MIKKFKIQNSKFKILTLGLLFIMLLLLQPTTYNLQPAYAGNTCITNTRVEKGLISAIDITNFGNPEGRCVVGNKSSFVPYKIPSYEDLKSLYYTQAKSSTDLNVEKHDSKASLDDLDGKKIKLIGSNNHLYHFTGSLTIAQNNDINGTNAGVIFVDGELTINADEVGNKDQAGVVFVTGGNVNIAKAVKRIDAVIISSGTIRTAGSSCTTSSEEVATKADALTVNGSLISLDARNPIKFCRKLAGNLNDDYPAEVIINQPKYLVILRNLFADTLQKWSEIQ